MKIVYITRPKGLYSIERVFQPIINVISTKKGYDIKISHSSVGCNMMSTMLTNIKKYYKLSKRKDTICHITCEVRYCGIFMDRENTILTTHDTYSLCNPNSPWYAKLYCYWIQFYFPMRHLKYLTCISEKTRDELIEFFPWSKSKLRVIHNPINELFSYTPYSFNCHTPLILHVGTAENKNLIRVIKALSGINCCLRIIGKLSDMHLTALKENKINYSNGFDLTDEEIMQEYKKADIVSFPSLFEGFGMPIIEAQAIGRPVLTSCIEPMKTISNDAAVLVDPTDVNDIRNGFLTLINEEKVRDYCIINGLENVKKYKADAIARDYLRLYQEVEYNMNKK